MTKPKSKPASTPVPETNREAFRRMAQEARERQKDIPAWMRTPPREPTAWNDANRVARDAAREAEKKAADQHDD